VLHSSDTSLFGVNRTHIFYVKGHDIPCLGWGIILFSDIKGRTFISAETNLAIGYYPKLVQLYLHPHNLFKKVHFKFPSL
jgi:hypothetical protein